MNRPIVFITLLFVAGIILAKIIDISFWIVGILIALSFLLILSSLFFNNSKNSKTAYIILLCLVFLLGAARYQISTMVSPNDVSKFVGKATWIVTGEIVSEPRFIKDRAFFELKVSKLRKADKEAAVSGMVQVQSQSCAVEYGDVVEVQGILSKFKESSNPGVLGFGDYLNSKGIACELKSNRSPPRIISRGGGNPLVKLSFAVRDRLLHVAQTTLPPPYADLQFGLVFGSRVSPLDSETKEDYKRAGVSHLLCASGMNLAIFVGVILSLGRILRLPLWLCILAASLINGFYVLIAGLGSSIMRAAVMTEIAMLAQLFERDNDFFSSFAAAALVLLGLDPKSIFEPGFQLSFAATWSVVVMAPAFENYFIKYLPKFLAALLSVSFAPVLTTTPITMYHFSQFSLVAVLTNLVVLPWVENLMILGFISTLLGTVFLFGAEVLNGANLVLLVILNWITKTFAHLPGAFAYTKQITLPLIFGYYAGLFILVEILKGKLTIRFNKKTVLITSLFICAVLACHAAASEVSAFKNELIISVLDVSQGDSILVECPSGKTMLIDGGDYEMGRRVIVPVLNKKGINKLDVVVLSHPHDDHVGGLPYVLKNIKTDLVLDIGEPHPAPNYIDFIKTIERKKIRYAIARAGQVLNLDQEIKAYLISPREPLLEDTNSDLNNNSIVMRLEYKNFSMLFMGDAEREEEERITSSKLQNTKNTLQSTILKIGHHGSATSTSQEFLEAVKPKYAVISVGKYNKFGHPNFGTIKRLEGVGAEVYRTDQDGAVVIRTDGEKVQVCGRVPRVQDSSRVPRVQDSSRVPRVQDSSRVPRVLAGKEMQ